VWGRLSPGCRHRAFFFITLPGPCSIMRSPLARSVRRHGSRQFEPPCGRNKPAPFSSLFTGYFCHHKLSPPAPAHPLSDNKKRSGAKRPAPLLFLFFIAPVINGSFKVRKFRTCFHLFYSSPTSTPRKARGLSPGSCCHFSIQQSRCAFCGFCPDVVNMPPLRFSGRPVRGFNRMGKGSGHGNKINLCPIYS